MLRLKETRCPLVIKPSTCGQLLPRNCDGQVYAGIDDALNASCESGDCPDFSYTEHITSSFYENYCFGLGAGEITFSYSITFGSGRLDLLYGGVLIFSDDTLGGGVHTHVFSYPATGPRYIYVRGTDLHAVTGIGITPSFDFTLGCA